MMPTVAICVLIAAGASAACVEKLCIDIYKPVCGSDGKTYPNDCTLSNAQCVNPLLTKAYDGACCTKQCCPYQQCQVADSGEQYCADTCAPGRCKKGQRCELVAVQCVRAPCPPVAQCTSCGAIQCPMIYDPVCGSDGKTYSNGCALGAAKCRHPSLVEVSKGECDCSKEKLCAMIADPICATNGVTYGNLCLFAKAQCAQPGLRIDYRGQCDRTCDRICAKLFRPVCSSQGVTYANLCELKRAACRDRSIRVQHEGICACP